MIYNYFISDYVHREHMRSNNNLAHKKSELKKIYSDIVKLNADTPSYLIQPSSDAQSFALQLKDNSLALQNTLKALQSDGLTSAFFYKEAVSDNKDAASITINTEDYSKLPAPFTMEINHLALPQINTSNVLPADRNFKEGTYVFQIITEEEPFSFSFHIKEKTTNAAVMQHISQAINRSAIPVSAHTVTNTKKNTTQLTLESEYTGTPDGNPIFICVDQSAPPKNAGCVNLLGLNNVTQNAQNAEITLDGQKKNSLTNTFNLFNTLQISLQKKTETPMHISFTSDSQKILQEINHLSESYNTLVDLSYSHEKPPRLATLMLHDLKKIFSNAQSALKDCGVTFDENGYMKISTDLAEKAAQDGKFEDILGKHTSLASSAYQYSQSFSLNPMKYIQDKLIITYPNPTKEHFANPYITSEYSGMLFNSYC